MTKLAAMLLAAAAAGCGTARELEGGTPFCPSWKQDVGAPLAARCAGCHGGDTPAGGVDLSSYAAAIATPDRAAIAAAVDPATADEVHRPSSDLHPLLEAWAIDCQASYVRSSIHPPGILDPESDGFHGKEVARQGFRMESCAGCHGDDFEGGAAGVSCTTCHTEPGGPTACTTCHGTPPASGAHLAHVTSPTLERPVACAGCHVVPDVYTAAGHVTTAAGRPDPAPAEVTFGDLAKATVIPGARRGPPAYDPATAACSNVHCHGDTLGDSRAAHPRPVWTGGPEQAACGSCHGTPPAGHPERADCASCHVPGSGVHLDGVIDLGDPAAGCLGCHGAPGRPLSGAHRAHLESVHALAAPLACADCHVVPQAVTAAGHLDSPPPAEVTFGALASARGFEPRYTADGQSCAVYCHGGDSVSWEDAPGRASCGTCHGIPPATGRYHTPDLTLRDCVRCHAGTVDAYGNILQGAGGNHINGRTDLVPN
jgi:predicted CxxxxCH...CXXCH cytochrome family protein